MTKPKKNLPMLKIIALTITTVALAAFTTVHAQTAPAAAPPNDAQIAQIVLTADSVDVDYGKLAVKKTKNAEVKAFAETMIRDHTAVNDKATALAKKIGLTPEASDTSKSLKSDGDKMMAKLKGMHGAEFDKAYIDNEVAYHESVIGASRHGPAAKCQERGTEGAPGKRQADLRISSGARRRLSRNR